MDRGVLYKELYERFVKAYGHSKSKQNCQKEINIIWNKIKNDEKLPEKVKELLNTYSTKAMKVKGKLFNYWSSAATKSSISHDKENKSNLVEVDKSKTLFSVVSDEIDFVAEPSQVTKSSTVDSIVRCAKTERKVQDSLKQENNLINGDLIGLMKRKECGQFTSVQENELIEKKKKKELEKNLKKKKDSMLRSRKF
ncbi:uncharacterized protein LOC124819348 [Hydra vulgaris]|uniref:uncharacterized protein LOC124819348 n=1 Tax=Hydra vulgaris TaxID=6087 RepID=UPI0032EA061A